MRITRRGFLQLSGVLLLNLTTRRLQKTTAVTNEIKGFCMPYCMPHNKRYKTYLSTIVNDTKGEQR